LLLLASAMNAAVRRVVILKVDGLPQWFVESALVERHAENGKSKLPWIQYFFMDRGVYLKNFYTRGISLSVPSWQLLDTGHHTEIHGNAEYDRYTLRSYDYLNFFPFYVNYARSKRVDMPAVEVLDSVGVPLLLDRFPYQQRYQGFQLFQRGVRWNTLESGLRKRFTTRPIQQLFDEWQAGFEVSSVVTEQLERELIQKLSDPSILYLDYYSGEFDHQSHLTNDRAVLLSTLEELDQLVGRMGRAIQASPLAAETVFAMVSDHGMNTSPTVYSQGFSLINFFNSAQGGGHHVITNRHTMSEYKIRGLNPLVNKVLSASSESLYLANQAEEYPTAILDLDGNERASIHLRNNTLNQLHMLLLKLSRKQSRTSEFADAVVTTIDQKRASWERAVQELEEEIGSLKQQSQALSQKVKTTPSQSTPEDRDAGLDQVLRRKTVSLQTVQEDERNYSEYARKLRNLLALRREQLMEGAFKIEDLIPAGAMGEPNTVADLRNYAVGWNSDGRTFRHIDYLEALKALRVRNNVQAPVNPSPVDFIAIALPEEHGILLYGGEDRQAKILMRGDGAIRYVPVGEWKTGLPLQLWEDPALETAEDRATWLDRWHSEEEWFRAVHRTRYSNGIIGLTEYFHTVTGKRRQLVQADMLVLANDHWNFNVRGFNPGGNHGSFFRIATHSVLMMWGGEKTGLPKHLSIDEPYDSLSFVPTILRLMGKPAEQLPGPVIRDLFPPN